ncbi:hypothetical protein QMP26_38135 [Enterocloster clostridioformis]|uniref:hypothetical protein n=1 Tax=Enterocloster clostridioformis TaxID=1531 RepID=UPI002675608B|nr:hypothetical protein [Enterocloster clostridioformis]
MNADEILKIIQAIPKYIQYIYPGYLSIYAYLFFRGKTLKDNNYIFVKSIAISYIYLWLIEWLKQVVMLKKIINRCFFNAPYELKQNACLIMLSILLAYIFYRLTLSKYVGKLLSLLSINTTFYDNEIEMLSDFDEGAWLCVYLKDDDVVYEGALGYKELEDDRRKYICLNSYYKYFLNNRGKPKSPYIENHDEEPDQTVMIFYDSIKRIEKRA